MGCGCGNKKKGTQAFTMTTSDGKTTTHSTKLEAEAAKIRAGGGTVKAKT